MSASLSFILTSSPNVDKKSMIRWNQTKIHQKRRDRQDKISALKLEQSLNFRMLKALEIILATSDPLNQTKQLSMLTTDAHSWEKELERNVYTLVMTARDPRFEPPIPDDFIKTKLQMSTLAKNILDSSATDKTIAINNAIETINQRQSLITAEIQKEEKNILSNITTENITTGFDKTIVSKKNSNLAAAAESTQGTAQKIETIHDPSTSSKNTPGSQDDDDEEADYITYQPAAKFSTLTSMEKSYSFLNLHPELASQKHSDNIMAHAFRLEMDNKSEQAKVCIHQSLILQYCGLLGQNGTSIFFKRMESPNGQARQMFMKDLNDTFLKISNRVKEIKTEKENEENREKFEALERVRIATQPDGSLALPVLEDGEGKERAQVFATFPRDFQEALLLQDVDKINTYLASLSKEEADEVVKKSDEVGLLTLSTEEEEEEEM